MIRELLVGNNEDEIENRPQGYKTFLHAQLSGALNLNCS